MCGNSDSDVYEIETRSFKLMVLQNVSPKSNEKKESKLAQDSWCTLL